jgi:hypothetical protein
MFAAMDIRLKSGDDAKEGGGADTAPPSSRSAAG